MTNAPIRAVARLALTATATFAIIACGDSSTEPKSRATALDLSAVPTDLDLGDSATALVRVLDVDGTALAERATLASSDTTVIVVRPDGRLVARALGHATISARAEGATGTLTGSAEVKVSRFVRSVGWSLRTAALHLGDTVTVVAQAVDRGSAPIAAPDAVLRYASSDTTVVRIDPVSGLARVVAEGAATITVSATAGGGSSASANVALHGDLVRLDGNVAFTSVSFGFYAACGLGVDQQAYCWGAGGSAASALGNGQSVLYDRQAPTAVSGGLHFTSVDSDNRGSCGVTTDGLVYCWGNATGVRSQTVPTRMILGGDAALRASAVQVHTDGGACAIDVGGESWCWGRNVYAQLGSTSSPRPEFVETARPIPGGLHFKELKPGYESSCGITTADAVYCWGVALHFNGTAPRGDGYSDLPQAVPVPGPMHSLASFWFGYCALDADGAAWCWGTNSAGALGVGVPSSNVAYAPVKVATAQRFTALKASEDGVCGLTADGQLWCWGRITRTVSRLLTTSSTPIAIARTRRFTSFAVSTWSVCGVTADGAVYCGNTEPGAF